MKITIPWIRIGILIGKLVKLSRGGIDKKEAEELLGDLGDLIASISIQLN